MKSHCHILYILLVTLFYLSCSDDSDNNNQSTDSSDAGSTTRQDSGKDAEADLDGGMDSGPNTMDASGMDGSNGDANDGSTTETTDLCLDGPISRPGEYCGYSEVLYPEYELSSQYVEVTDGTKLAMDLYRPKDDQGQVVTTPLPVLWMHTPYNRREFMENLPGESYPGAAARLVKYGYVVAIVDFRGLYASYGTNIAYNRGEWIDAARMDAYDITEWLADQEWSTGDIGMWGCSATGGSQMQAATTAPPHLKAIFPMSCEFDAYPFGVPGGMSPGADSATREPPNTVPPETRNEISAAVDEDTDGSMLAEAISEHENGVDNLGYVPYRDSVAELIQETWWVKSSAHTYLHEINDSDIAIYLAANWNEGMTKYGPFFTFNNVTTPTKLIVGPASHCAWFTVERETGFELPVEEHRFFDYWLKGIENGVMDEPKITYYTYNAPESDQWRTADQWPLSTETRTKYYLGDTTLDPTSPTDEDLNDEITVDYDVTDENMLEKGLVYETPALDADMEITGHPVMELWVSSTATDGDFIATIQDVAPDETISSYYMNGRLRASHREIEDAPYNNLGLPWHPSTEDKLIPLEPGEPTLLTFDILPISIIIKEGHRIRVVLNFADSNVSPVLDPAPTVTVYRNATHPSSITLPIIDD